MLDALVMSSYCVPNYADIIGSSQLWMSVGSKANCTHLQESEKHMPGKSIDISSSILAVLLNSKVDAGVAWEI